MMFEENSKNGVVVLIIGCFCLNGIKHVNGVPPTPSDRFWNEIGDVKTMMANIAGQLEKFNNLYLGTLEPRMLSMTSTLTSIDSNVKNLQERAHVWDTFQLHVAAWNEQINTLDKKVDIISKGQEKMLNVDGRLSSIANIEYKVERIIGKLDVTDNTLQSISRTIENQIRDPLLNEFTSRGVLSTLKVVERKVDRVLTSVVPVKKNISSTAKKVNITNDLDQKNKLLIRCNTPPIVEELLHDISSKVDVMFDKISNKYVDEKDFSEFESDGIESLSIADPIHELKTELNSEEKLVSKIWRRLTEPSIKTTKALETLEEQLQTISNATFAVLENESQLNENLLNCCERVGTEVKSFTGNTNTLLKRIEGMMINLENKEDKVITAFEQQFSNQRNSLKLFVENACNRKSNIPNISVIDSDSYGSGDESSFEVSSFLTTEKVNVNEKLQTKDCSDLPQGYPNGIYRLGEIYRENFNRGSGRDFSTRYCDMNTNGGGWTVIQRRGDFGEPKQNFSLSWNEYKYGFGSLDTEFWLGNDLIHKLTYDNDVVLRIELEDFDGNTAWAEYSTFKVNSESNGYRLEINGYSGNASDSLSAHNNVSFSTYDMDNDDAPPCCPCAPAYGGGWWFYSCFEANLNGVYYNNPRDNDYFRGLIWEHWLGNYSLRKTRMLLRPKNFLRAPENEDGSRSTTFIPEDP